MSEFNRWAKNPMLPWLTSNAPRLSLFGAVAAFLWPVFQFVITRRRDLQFREFEVYHRLIKELVMPDPQEGVLWMDRQAAVVFELRHFPRYYAFTGRTPRGLRVQWVAAGFPRLIEEIDLTLEFLRNKKA